ncbi:unnamed protein product, partial [Rotaria sordida]
ENPCILTPSDADPSTHVSTTTPYTRPLTTTIRMTTTASIEVSTATTDTAQITTTTYAACSCQNGGICKSIDFDKPMCECKPGFNGAQCENKVSPTKNNCKQN